MDYQNINESSGIETAKDLYALVAGYKATNECCSQHYWKWEEEIKLYLEGKGHKVGQFWSSDWDSCGPLVRSVRIDDEIYSYG